MGQDLDLTSYLYGANSVFIEELFEKYRQNPDSVEESWRQLFDNLQEQNPIVDFSKAASWVNNPTRVIGVETADVPKNDNKETIKVDHATAKASALIRAYRTRGHLLANLDPLGLEKIPSEKEINLDPEFYGFTESDLDETMDIDEDVLGVEVCTLRDLIQKLKAIYSNKIGVEYMHIQSLEQKNWIEKKLESFLYEQDFSKEDKKQILQKIIEVEGFEQFLHIKFPGSKRFSVEGGENSVTALDQIIKKLAELNAEEVILGMPHRGRLNVLTNVMRKPYHSMLSEFMGNLAHPEDMDISGDVKYHLGTSSDVEINGKEVHLSLTANPSHLEAVNPVVAGKVRAKQDLKQDKDRNRIVGILLHGDAAFAGQGVVPETLSLGDLTGYKTGGTVHIIVNNQIGFTTSPKKARKSRYPTEVAKVVEAPIFHVNGDDPEAVIRVSKIAAEYQQKFGKDVVIDVICYRLHGHNETDEPMFTQPLMYKKIGEHQTPAALYSQKLIKENVITEEDYTQMKKDWRKFLDGELKLAEKYKPNDADWLAGKWQGLKSHKDSKLRGKEETGVDAKKLKAIGLSITERPQDFDVNKKILRLLDNRRKMIETGKNIDWGTAEALAFGSLVEEGTRVRVSGQDSGRGTFSHRQSVLSDQSVANQYIPLNNISDKQNEFEVIDSNLSEFAVLGFEYGYSTVIPESLTIWEAQFGDFANGAQVIFDQFISTAEIKWLRMSGLTLLLPHGYEGQGPEHSSARLERMLQLCGDDNMQIVNCTTPANIFHVLRRQVKRDFRKPLIIMSPKSLLRKKEVVSEMKEMTKGTFFKPVIEETSSIIKTKNVNRVVITSGKIFYELYEKREEKKLDNIAIIRLEQYYPLPEEQLINELKKYPNAEIIWCQEEPENMGAWNFLDRKLEDILVKIKHKSKRPRYVGRKMSASPAVGYLSLHNAEQSKILVEALTF